MKTFDSKQDIIYDLIRREGGLVNDSADKGGLTKYGISQRSYPELDIINLTKEDAYSIYDRDYWHNGREDFWDLDRLNSWIRPLLFDMNVNHGGRGATLILQRAIRNNQIAVIDVDGIFGSQTFGAVSALTEAADNPNREITPSAVIKMIVEERIKYYNSIVNRNISQRRFISGWISRALYFL